MGDREARKDLAQGWDPGPVIQQRAGQFLSAGQSLRRRSAGEKDQPSSSDSGGERLDHLLRALKNLEKQSLKDTQERHGGFREIGGYGADLFYKT